MGERAKITTKAPETKRENPVSQTQATERSQSLDSPIDRILFLQRTVGNQAVQRVMKSGVLQAKLRIGQPNDKYEQEADRVAEKVVRMPEPRVQRQPEEKEEEEPIQSKPLAGQITPFVQRQPEEEEKEEEEPIQTKAISEQIVSTVQRQEEEEKEEEPLQTKLLSAEHSMLQRQEEEEEKKDEEEPIQVKSLSNQIIPQIQKQPEDEEELLQGKFETGLVPQIQHQEEEKKITLTKPLLQPQNNEEEEKIQTKPLLLSKISVNKPSIQKKEGNAVPYAGRGVENQLSLSKSGGSSLPINVRETMESRFGVDFSQVRVHTGSVSTQMNKMLNAQAFTVGNDVYFGEDKYDINSKQGKKLLAHELTHTVQQGKSVQRQQQPSEKRKEKDKDVSRFILSPIWPLFKAGIIGFGKEFLTFDLSDQIKIGKKFAKIASGRSIDYIWGVIQGIFSGIWDGISSPFIALGHLIYFLYIKFPMFIAQMHIKLIKIAKQFIDSYNDTSQQFIGTWNEIKDAILLAKENVYDWINNLFKKQNIILLKKFLEGIRTKSLKLAQDYGAKLARKFKEFMLSNKAEKEIGKGVGYVIGTIIFEVVLAYFTVGIGTVITKAIRGASWIIQAASKGIKAIRAAIKSSKTYGFLGNLVRGGFSFIADAFVDLFRLVGKLKLGKKFSAFWDKIKNVWKKIKEFSRKDKKKPPKRKAEDKRKLRERRRRYKKNAKALDDEGGHSYADHGAHVKEWQHRRRLKTGKTPSGVVRDKPDVSSSFATNKAHVDAYNKVLDEFPKEVFKKKKGKIIEPKQLKKKFEIDIIMEGAGFEYKLGPGGKLIKTKTNFVRAVFELVDEATQKYKLVTMFPTNTLK